jgi:hypothetical protein
LGVGLKPTALESVSNRLSLPVEMEDEEDESESTDIPDTPDDSLDIHDRPTRRAGFILPEKRKRKFQDGTPRPTKTLKMLLKRTKEVYRYTRLAPDEDIRVLIVEPGRRADATTDREADPIRCRLVTSALPSTQSTQGIAHPRQVIKYEALSYYWGNDEPSIPITIASYNTRTSNPRLSMASIVQKKFWIRPNLYAALIELRDPTEEVRLWVDALCIDQDYVPEKTAQVSRMHEIYSEASNICIWLGVGALDPVIGTVDSENTRQTFDFIREMLSLKRLDQLVSNEKYAPRWLAFVELMRNRWFSRRWVVQELALAKEATVHYGREVMQWTDFADAVALFVTKHDQINMLLKRHSTDPDPIGDMRALGANALVEASSNLFRKSNDGKILERLLSLEVLVSTLLAFEAKDPRDIVYAVLSIANDTPYSDSTIIASRASTPLAAAVPPLGDPRITPNYEKSHSDVFCDFIDYCIERSSSLDIICRHWAPATSERRRSMNALTANSHLSMPTWVSLVTDSAFGGPGLALKGRCNGDSLVGTPSRKNYKNYNASAGLKPHVKIERLPVQGTEELFQSENADSRSYFSGGHNGGHGSSSISTQVISTKCTGVLYAKGVPVDTIGKLSPRAAQGMILQECLEIGGWSDDYDELEKVPDSLWRTLVADRGPNGTNAPSWYHRACLECFTHITQNGDLSTGALMENPNTPSTMVTFLRRVQQVVWNRKFLLSKGGDEEDVEKQLFGLAPTRAQEGDLICILFGCSVPVILRKMESQDDPFYFFIGEAYIHGMMDGEAFPKELPEWPYEGNSNYVNFNIK